MTSRLGNNPLLNTDTAFDVEAEREHLGIDAAKIGRKRKEDIIREKGSQQGLTEEWTRATFIIRVDQLEILKDYGYTQRLKMKEVLQEALTQFIEGIDTDSLLKHR